MRIGNEWIPDRKGDTIFACCTAEVIIGDLPVYRSMLKENVALLAGGIVLKREADVLEAVD